jgi:hypothetical protein
VRIDLTAPGIELYVTPLDAPDRGRRGPGAPCGRNQRDPVHVGLRLAATDVRRSCQRRGNRCGGPRR